MGCAESKTKRADEKEVAPSSFHRQTQKEQKVETATKSMDENNKTKKKKERQQTESESFSNDELMKEEPPNKNNNKNNNNKNNKNDKNKKNDELLVKKVDSVDPETGKKSSPVVNKSDEETGDSFPSHPVTSDVDHNGKNKNNSFETDEKNKNNKNKNNELSETLFLSAEVAAPLTSSSTERTPTISPPVVAVVRNSPPFLPLHDEQKIKAEEEENNNNNNNNNNKNENFEKNKEKNSEINFEKNNKTNNEINRKKNISDEEKTTVLVDQSEREKSAKEFIFSDDDDDNNNKNKNKNNSSTTSRNQSKSREKSKSQERAANEKSEVETGKSTIPRMVKKKRPTSIKTTTVAISTKEEEEEKNEKTEKNEKKEEKNEKNEEKKEEKNRMVEAAAIGSQKGEESNPRDPFPRNSNNFIVSSSNNETRKKINSSPSSFLFSSSSFSFSSTCARRPKTTKHSLVTSRRNSAICELDSPMAKPQEENNLNNLNNFNNFNNFNNLNNIKNNKNNNYTPSPMKTADSGPTDRQNFAKSHSVSQKAEFSTAVFTPREEIQPFGEKNAKKSKRREFLSSARANK